MAGGSDRLAHTETAPRCHLSQARSRSERRRQKEQDGNANGSPRVRAGYLLRNAGTLLQPWGQPWSRRWRGDEHWDLMAPGSFQASV